MMKDLVMKILTWASYEVLIGLFGCSLIFTIVYLYLQRNEATLNNDEALAEKIDDNEQSVYKRIVDTDE